MIILYFILTCVFIGFIRAVYRKVKLVKYYYNLECEKEALLQAQWEEEQEKREELEKQLEAVQYQLKLLEALDSFRSDNMMDEKEVKKALSLEKQYNALWTKERKLKRELEKLGG